MGIAVITNFERTLIFRQGGLDFFVGGESDLEETLANSVVTARYQDRCLVVDGFGADDSCSAAASAAGFERLDDQL